jgi:hypothetical protein
VANEELARQLSDLFTATAAAHHKAFIATNGEDAEWPMWYAQYLHEKLSTLLASKFTMSELADLLLEVSKEQPLRAPGAEWTAYYASWFLERYPVPETNA